MPSSLRKQLLKKVYVTWGGGSKKGRKVSRIILKVKMAQYANNKIYKTVVSFEKVLKFSQFLFRSIYPQIELYTSIDCEVGCVLLFKMFYTIHLDM